MFLRVDKVHCFYNKKGGKRHWWCVGRDVSEFLQVVYTKPLDCYDFAAVSNLIFDYPVLGNWCP